MRIKFGVLFLILIVLYLFRNRLKKSEFFRSAGTIFNIVFYIYLFSLLAAFIYQVISNLLR
ncbi:MAG: hypothetical protein KAS21_08970 [Candidatus Aminicenantes bacterium]|nr:hypothetical protein [Candidatus Aminicenantes bacterium]